MKADERHYREERKRDKDQREAESKWRRESLDQEERLFANMSALMTAVINSAKENNNIAPAQRTTTQPPQRTPTQPPQRAMPKRTTAPPPQRPVPQRSVPHRVSLIHSELHEPLPQLHKLCTNQTLLHLHSEPCPDV